MSEHLVLYVDRLMRPANGPTAQATEIEVPVGGGYDVESSGSSCSSVEEKRDDEENVVLGEDEPLIQAAECRICQEEDAIKNLEIPCACSGSLKYAHRKCVQRWCNEKRDITCEICHQPYQPGYTTPPAPPHPEDATIDIGGWTISGAPLDSHDPRFSAIAEAERQFLEAEYDDYAATTASGAAFCRSAALILMSLLFLRHALNIPDSDGDNDTAPSFFSLFLLKAAGFLLPCYIMAWAISILQRRRQRQEAAALAAAQFAIVLQSGLHRGLQLTMAPPPPPANLPQEAA
ncbi:hypothetical protein Nepgr_033006 [Nepenthes gracilis]|uniref:RING-CH-type domain-containing protein n=1 Tax=Nepenthes gracilis TaxID=150966 RepID=A0AAD3TLI2_NEPGR|nr:hypothetical protein Nepgr_033006 [Nepenthes gracilis]